MSYDRQTARTIAERAKAALEKESGKEILFPETFVHARLGIKAGIAA